MRLVGMLHQPGEVLAPGVPGAGSLMGMGGSGKPQGARSADQQRRTANKER